MRRGVRLWAVCAAALLLSSCAAGRTGDSGGTPVQLFFAASSNQSGEDAIRSESREIPVSLDTEESARAILGLLLAGPETSGLENPFPEGTRLLSCQEEGGTMKVDLSEKYGGLSGIHLSIADYCITLSLCQLKGVDKVSVTVEGDPLPYRERQMFSPGDVVLGSKLDEPLLVDASLYFVDNNSNLLAVEERSLDIYEEKSSAEQIVTALLAGPTLSYLHSPIPKGTRLLSASMDQGICKVDLSHEFTDSCPAEERAQQMAVYAIVNSLTSLSAVDRVQLSVEGQTLDYYGSVFIRFPLQYNEALTRSGEAAPASG